MSKASPANGVGFSSSAHAWLVEKSMQAARQAVPSSRGLRLPFVLAARQLSPDRVHVFSMTTLRQGDTREGPSEEGRMGCKLTQEFGKFQRGTSI